MYVSLPFASPTRKQDNKHGQPHDTTSFFSNQILMMMLVILPSCGISNQKEIYGFKQCINKNNIERFQNQSIIGTSVRK